MDNASETTSRSGGIVGAVLLMAVLFALVLGVYGAVSIDTFRPARMQQTTSPASSTAPAPPIAAVSPAPAPTVAIPPDQVNPAAGRTFEAAKPAYWLEYGAYRGSFYAQKLVERLGRVGLKAEIRRVPGAGGALFYSVRSSAPVDRSNANAAAKLAAQLGIAPLLHRGDRSAVAQPVVAKVEAAAAPAAHYWVQFGAYNTPHYAMALRDQLRRSGIDATILERHQPGFARYMVRTPASLGRGEAHSLAARSQSVFGIQPLVGQAPAPAA